MKCEKKREIGRAFIKQGSLAGQILRDYVGSFNNIPRVVGFCVSESHQFATRACFNSTDAGLWRRALYEMLPWWKYQAVACSSSCLLINNENGYGMFYHREKYCFSFLSRRFPRFSTNECVRYTCNFLIHLLASDHRGDKTLDMNFAKCASLLCSALAEFKILPRSYRELLRTMVLSFLSLVQKHKLKRTYYSS